MKVMYPYCKYADETEAVFSHIMKNGNGEEIIHVHFERPTEKGFDSVIFELQSCKILYKDGNYSEEDIKEFRETVKKVHIYSLNMQEKEEYKVQKFLLKINTK